MTMAYYFSTLSFMAGNSFMEGQTEKTKNNMAESNQKMSLAMLGFALGKCLTSFLAERIAAGMKSTLKNHVLLIVGGLCILFTLIVSYASRVQSVLIPRPRTMPAGSSSPFFGASKTRCSSRTCIHATSKASPRTKPELWTAQPPR